MIDFTKLRDLLVEKKCVSSNDYGKEDPFIGIYWKDLIDIINQCDSKKWISVEEALPERGSLVFIRLDHGGYSVRLFTNYDKSFIDTKGGKVTHWMPIPPLKGGK
jgi:hypothetical protein